MPTRAAPTSSGPNLWGVLGEPIGQGRGFAFSDALAKKGGNWDWDNLGQWLTSPKAFAPGTKMTFAGLSNPQDRANVIAFLNSHSDAPKPLPAAPAASPARRADAKPPALVRTTARRRPRRSRRSNAGGRHVAADERRRRPEATEALSGFAHSGGPTGSAARPDGRRKFFTNSHASLASSVQWIRSRSCGAITPSSTIASKFTTRFQ